LRLKSNFLNQIKLFLPVQSRLKKYSGFPKPQITFITQPSTPLEGRIAIVTDAGLDAMDAAASGVKRDGRAGFATRERSDGALTNGAAAYGEVVWS